MLRSIEADARIVGDFGEMTRSLIILSQNENRQMLAMACKSTYTSVSDKCLINELLELCEIRQKLRASFSYLNESPSDNV